MEPFALAVLLVDAAAVLRRILIPRLAIAAAPVAAMKTIHKMTAFWTVPA